VCVCVCVLLNLSPVIYSVFSDLCSCLPLLILSSLLFLLSAPLLTTPYLSFFFSPLTTSHLSTLLLTTPHFSPPHTHTLSPHSRHPSQSIATTRRAAANTQKVFSSSSVDDLKVSDNTTLPPYSSGMTYNRM
jgi:hypothetical protein